MSCGFWGPNMCEVLDFFLFVNERAYDDYFIKDLGGRLQLCMYAIYTLISAAHLPTAIFMNSNCTAFANKNDHIHTSRQWHLDPQLQSLFFN